MYAHSLTADADGLVRARLVNDRLGLAFELEYDQRQFPSFFQWLHLRGDAYAVGFEPSTHPVTGDQAARDDGTMTWPCRRSRLGLTSPAARCAKSGKPSAAPAVTRAAGTIGTM